LSLKFFAGGKFITLSGLSDSGPIQAQLHHIRRLHKTDAIAEVFTMQVLQIDNNGAAPVEFPPNLPPDLIALLLKYSQVFQTPTGLPPPRSQDHSIPLLDESHVVKVRPYRYPHSQKEQIEKMVSEMLQQGIIQPSTSPFSSPIILVKKKDGT
jgi:hypothetical protein